MLIDSTALEQKGIKPCADCEEYCCTQCEYRVCAACRAPLCDMCFAVSGSENRRDQCLECAAEWHTESRHRRADDHAAAEQEEIDFQKTRSPYWAWRGNA